MVWKSLRLTVRLILVAAITLSVVSYWSGAGKTQSHGSSHGHVALDAAKTKVAGNLDKSADSAALESQFNVRLPAAFETKSTIVVGCNEFEYHPVAITQILAALAGHVQVLALVTDDNNQRQIVAALAEQGISRDGIRFWQVPLDSMWVRDYGPKFVLHGRRVVAVSANYVENQRENDEAFAEKLAARLDISVTTLPINLAGGNLMTNGRGHGLMTTMTEVWNQKLGVSRQRLVDYLGANYGFGAITLVEPLHGEPTGHVDMFATFCSPTTIVLGEYDPQSDPENAALLERNYQTLKTAETAVGPLTVKRIPMPPHTLDAWPTYTNVIYANGTLLAPSYPQDFPEFDKQALALYKELLPDWNVVAIDCTSLIRKRGALHCISLGIPPIPPRAPIVDQLAPTPSDIR